MDFCGVIPPEGVERHLRWQFRAQERLIAGKAQIEDANAHARAGEPGRVPRIRADEGHPFTGDPLLQSAPLGFAGLRHPHGDHVL